MKILLSCWTNYFTKKNEKDLVDLLKILNLYKTDMANKSKGILRKIIEKFYEEFIDNQELSDDMKKERPPINDQASPHDDQKHNVPVKSTMSSSNANGTTDVTQQPIQANDEGNLRSDIKVRGQIGEAGQKYKLTHVSLIHQIKQAKIMQPHPQSNF